MSTTSAIRSRNSKIFASITELGRQSLRKIAEATGLSKDSVARGLAALSKRNRNPESHLWETEEGKVWLHRMVPATVYVFGIKGNQGAERITEFFKCIRVDTHVAVSPTAVRNMKREMEEQVANFQQEQEARQAEKGEIRDIVASGDETFFDDKILLVLMDLPSGYLVVEEEADDRGYDTWEAKATPRLQQLGLRVRHFISDRGKSLIKLAMSGFGCLAGADVFHVQYDISKWLGRVLYGKFGQASKQLKDAKEKLTRVGAADFHDLARYHSADSMAMAAEFTYRAALMRKESRSGHFREDFPERDDANWFKWITIETWDGAPNLATLPVPVEKYPLQPGR